MRGGGKLRVARDVHHPSSRDKSRTTSTFYLYPPPTELLTEAVQTLYSQNAVATLKQEELDQVWNEQGLVWKVGRFRTWLVERGLLSSISEEKFQSHMYELLQAFFVKGRVENKDGTEISYRASQESSGGETERGGPSDSVGCADC